MSRVVVIGGGASGLTAAIAAARAGAAVTVLEQNERPGKKLLASGNGKCNLTNLQLQAERYDCDSPDFLNKCLLRFTVEDTLSFFSDLGLETRDRNGWVYPVTDQASSVLQLLLMEAERLHVRVKTREKAETVLLQDRAEEARFLIKTRSWSYPADSVVISCGSPASSVHGSCDDGLRIAEGIGISSAPFLPALVPLKLKGKPPKKWTACRTYGTVTLLVNGREAGEDTGEIQLTENGISGIPVFQISREAVCAADRGLKTEIRLNLMPGRTSGETAALLRERHERHPHQDLRELLTGLLPDRIIAMVCAADGGSSPAGRASFDRTADLLCGMILPIQGPASAGQAQICSGGVLLKELTENLESRKQRGVYFAGETLNVAGPCGGYNLQWAWTSGMIAGSAAGGNACFC